MDEHEKITFAATVAAHEEMLATLLAHLLAVVPEDVFQAFLRRVERGPVLNPNAPPAPNIDVADNIAGFGMEYDQVIKRIVAQARAQAGR